MAIYRCRFVGKKYRKSNPLLLEYFNPPAVRAVGRIPGVTEKVVTYYERTGKRSGPYRHVSTTPSTIYTMADGSIVYKPNVKGKKLWVDLPE